VSCGISARAIPFHFFAFAAHGTPLRPAYAVSSS
jgi:hypothetical protein